MKSSKYILLAVAATLGLTSCEPEFDNELSNASYKAGEADFTTYVAIGNSLTSGYMDGTMYRSGQQYSFPNLLAQQFALVGGGEFTQPAFDADVNNVGGLLLGGNPIANTKMIINLQVGGPQNINAASTIEVSNLQRTAYNNMGVPGAKSFHLLAPGYGNLAGVATGAANPYFVRHATTDNTTVLADAMSKNPTFFTNWIGSNDVLAYALSGGTGVDRTGNMDPTTYGSNDITDPGYFAGVYSAIINALTSNGAKGVVATVPNVSSIPYFTTVPHNPLTAIALGGGDAQQGQATIAMLNGLFTGFNNALGAYQQPSRFVQYSDATGNPVLIVDETLPDMSAAIEMVISQTPYAQYAQALGQSLKQARHATANDLLVLTSSSIIGSAEPGYPTGLNARGVIVPLADEYVLIPSEQQAIATATTAYNNAIRQIAASKDLAVADMNAIMQQLSTQGIVVDGVNYGSGYFSTGTVGTVLFSLDGVHPNARGYALVTNEIIKVIEAHYGAKLPKYSPMTFPGATILTSN
nr:G-D-S-L family lipolytic protein [uncultured Flavobacterium sp.]